MRSPLILRVFKNNQLVEVKQFDQEQVVIGHNADVHLDLDGDGVAPIHCLIELRDNGYYICDLGSQSGTFKNGQAILDESISSGDEINVGPFKIIFYVGVPKPKNVPLTTPPVAPSAPGTSVGASVATATAATIAATAALTPTPPSPPAEEVKKETPKIPETPAVLLEKSATGTNNEPRKTHSQVEPKSERKIASTVAVSSPAKPEIRATGKVVSGKKKKGGSYAPESEIKDLKSYLHPTKGTSIQVIVAWKERILTTYHFRRKGVVRITENDNGQEKNQIKMPAGFAPKSWPLLEISNGVKVNVPNDMKFDLIQGNDSFTLDNLVKMGRAQKTNTGVAARLDQNEMICLSSVASELAIYIRYAPQPPVMPMMPPLLLTGSELTGVIMSLVMVSILALYISATTPKDWEEPKQDDVQRVAQVIFNAPKPSPTPVPVATPSPTPVAVATPVATPKPAPTPPPKKVVVADEKKEAVKKGKTATAEQATKAQQATRANEVAPKPEKNRPKKFTSTQQGGAVKQGQTAGANAQSANKDVSKMGLFSAFGSGGNRKQLDKAYSGSGEVLGMADKATGTSGFNEDRAGDDLGSKFKDTGAGGKGTATQGIAGIGTKGRSSGQAAYGAGDGLGSKSSVAIEPGGAEEDFAGTIDREAVRRVIKANLQQVKSCYERVLNTLPKGQRLEGKVMIKWTIVAKGAATAVSVDKAKTTLGNTAVENCIRDRLSSWVFPEPPEGMKADVSYPFVLNQSN